MARRLDVDHDCDDATVPFEDIYPFKRRPPDRRGNYGIAPSTHESGGRTGGSMRHEVSPGERGQYRLVFKSMPVPGLPDSLPVGRVLLETARGPIWTQRTHVLQRPGWRTTYIKHMDHDVVEVAAGYELMVCTIGVLIPDDLFTAFRNWRDEVLAAVGFVVAVLDERIAQEVVAEDLIVVDNSGAPRYAADHVQQVRAFPPQQRVLEAHREVIRGLASSDPSADDPVVAAARWYLRAAQSGVTPDAVVFLWIALEALAKPPFGTKLSKTDKKLTDVEWIEQALASTGVEPSAIEPTVGRLAGLRAEIVHGGVESPALLRDGYYVLEALTRVLLRQRLRTGAMAWPAFPDEPNLVSPLRELALFLRRFPRTRWRAPAS